ncbi:uncharacterized protein [Gossypium hirsutum]|uniref:Retrovirus-related Pol polyprotein from transposon TNT 1-94-like beta-barrel domain-containing protein n=1 Tax=Gossypium hirsutum TaxID=3635 RepID=A0A1U8M0F7_GOSHI|nr:uncharacterized protein LOC107932724 [Gossypium hirsutum]
MLQEEEIDSADFVKGLVIQRPDTGSGQMLCVNTARRRAMLKESTKKKADLTKTNNTRVKKLEWLKTTVTMKNSGCTNHRSPDATIFKTLDKSCKTKVKVGNGKFIKAEGKWDVLICTPTGNKVIPNVLLVPEIDRNLLSISQLLEKGYSVVFKG